MCKYFSHLIRVKLLLGAALIRAVTFFSVSAWSISNPVGLQKKEKLIEKAFSSTPQVQIIDIKSDKTSKKFGEVFEDNDEDWLKKLSFQIKNISNKPIVYLSLNLNFPETKSSGNMMSYPLSFGQKPGSRFKTSNAPLLLKVGETLNVKVDDSYDKLAHFIKRRHLLDDLHRIQVEVGFIVFEDKSAWSAGMFYKQDPDNPDKYLNIGDKPAN